MTERVRRGWHRDVYDPERARHFIGTTAALITAAAVTAGANVTNAVIGSKAAKGAAKAQVQSADKAAAAQERATAASLAEQKRQFDASQNRSAPYVNAGNTTMGHLMAGMGMADYMTAGAPGGKFGGPAQLGTAAELTGPNVVEPATAPAKVGGPLSQERRDSLRAKGAEKKAAEAKAADAIIAARTQGGEGIQKKPTATRVQWPDGSKAIVPTNQLEQYTALGATEAT